MAEYRTTEELLENNSVRSLILHLGIPAMFGQFFNMLYSMVDRIFVGRIPETGGIALASIGVCAPALTAVTAFAYMVGIGGASYMSISLGQKEHQRARDILGNAFLLLMGIAAFVTAALLMVRRPVLYMLGCSDMTRVCHLERQKWSPDGLHFTRIYAVSSVFMRLVES